jgi:hypothetical protein
MQNVAFEVLAFSLDALRCYGLKIVSFADGEVGAVFINLE